MNASRTTDTTLCSRSYSPLRKMRSIMTFRQPQSRSSLKCLIWEAAVDRSSSWRATEAPITRSITCSEIYRPESCLRHHAQGLWRVSKREPMNENYSADRLGDDVLAVMQALRIERPFQFGHFACR